MSLAEPSAVTVKREAEFLSPSSGPGIIITQRESHALNSASVKSFKRSSVQGFGSTSNSRYFTPRLHQKRSQMV